MFELFLYKGTHSCSNCFSLRDIDAVSPVIQRASLTLAGMSTFFFWRFHGKRANDQNHRTVRWQELCSGLSKGHASVPGSVHFLVRQCLHCAAKVLNEQVVNRFVFKLL